MCMVSLVWSGGAMCMVFCYTANSELLATRKILSVSQTLVLFVCFFVCLFVCLFVSRSSLGGG